MNYYRTYRPQKLADIDAIDRRELVTKLLSDPQKLSHAYLLVGPRGTGKTSTARIIAKVVNCERNIYAKGKGIEPCGECASCIAISKGTHLDVRELDAASNRGVDDIRSLRDEVGMLPAQGRYKVYIIDEVHMLTKEAFNALLKTLEEPPAYVLFILATTEEMRVPLTIVSRTVVISFTRATQEELLEGLHKIVKKEKLAISSSVLKDIAAAAQGSFRDGAKLLEVIAQTTDGSEDEAQKVLARGTTTPVYELMELILAKKVQDATAWVDAFSQKGGNVQWLIQSLTECVRERMLGAQTQSERTQSAKLSKALVTAYEQTRYSPVPDVPLLASIVEFSASV